MAPNSGTPGAFAPDSTRIQNEPIPVNYRSGNPIGGSYTAQCTTCNSWHRAHNKDDAIADANICCSNANGN